MHGARCGACDPTADRHIGYILRDRDGRTTEGPLRREERPAAPGWTLVIDDTHVDGRGAAVYLRHTDGGRIPEGPNVRAGHEVPAEIARLLRRAGGPPLTALDRDGRPVVAGPIREPVPGAPRQPGDRVVVVRVIDPTADAALVGAVGRVVHLEYSCGCGQRYPDDPMIGVELPGGVEEFWRDELAGGAP